MDGRMIFGRYAKIRFQQGTDGQRGFERSDGHG